MKKLQFYALTNLEHVAAMVEALEATGDLDVIQDDRHGYVTNAGHLMTGVEAISACYKGEPVYRALKKADAADAWLVTCLPGLLDPRVVNGSVSAVCPPEIAIEEANDNV